jgi:hypothetical protein
MPRERRYGGMKGSDVKSSMVLSLALLLAPAMAQAKPLYVSATGGNDATTYENNSAVGHYWKGGLGQHQSQRAQRGSGCAGG